MQRLSLRAFSLIELVVALSLMLAIGTLVVQLLVPAARWSSRSQARSQLQESGYQAVQMIRAQLQATNASALSIGANSAGAAVAYQTLQLNLSQALPGYNPDMNCIIWQSAAGTLTYRGWGMNGIPLPPGVTPSMTTPTRLTTPQLLLLPTVPTPNLKMLASNVIEFSLGSPSVALPNIGNPLQLHLKLQRQVTANIVDSCTFDQAILLRNAP